MYSFTFIKEKELKDRLYIVIYIYHIKSLSLKRTGGIVSVVLHTTQEQQQHIHPLSLSVCVCVCLYVFINYYKHKQSRFRRFNTQCGVRENILYTKALNTFLFLFDYFHLFGSSLSISVKL